MTITVTKGKPFEPDGMAQCRSILITKRTVQVTKHINMEQAEEFEYRVRSQYPNVRTDTMGDINGDYYTVIYMAEEENEQ